MKRSMLIVACAVGLSACGEPSVQDFIDDRELLSNTLIDCAALVAKGQESDTVTCNNALAAQKQVAKNMVDGLFGK